MPPKKQASSSKQDAKAAVKDAGAEEAPLQAVVLADSYNRRFEVLCQDQPRCLLPLCSTPLLSWTLESLSLSNVKQVFIFCGVHSEKIRAFVESSPYRHKLQIQCLTSQTAQSAGDALRELDAMQVLNHDNPFLLLHGPIVSNFNLEKMVDAHKKRKEADGNYIMTVGVGKGGRRHPESPLLLVHPPTSRLLHYTQHPLSPRHKRYAVPANLLIDPFPGVDEFEIWAGSPAYRDLGIDVCEADVPALCTENFDYHDLRRDFVNGVLTSELLGKKIAVYQVGAEADGSTKDEGRYVDRVRDTRTFGDITRDVLRRWAFPLAPDIAEPDGVQYELRKGNVYIARENVVLSRTTTLNGPLLLGPRTTLSHGTTISQSTLGADSLVGSNSRISSSYIFDNVRIGQDCVLQECMVGAGVVLEDGVVVGRGALLGPGVKLAKGVKVPEFARIGRERWQEDSWGSDDEEEEEDEDEKAERLAILGAESIGFLWPNEEEQLEEDSDSDGEDPYEHPRNKRLLQLGRRLSNVSSDDDTASTLSIATSSEGGSPESVASSASLADVPMLSLNLGPQATPAFHAEASASLARAFEEDHDWEDALLELRTLVMGYNAGVDAARSEVINAILGAIDVEGKGALQIKTAAVKLWQKWGGMVDKLSEDMLEAVLVVQAYCVDHFETHKDLLPALLQAMYEADIAEEDDFESWTESPRSAGEGLAETERVKWKHTLAAGMRFYRALEAAGESESDDESGEDESD